MPCHGDLYSPKYASWWKRRVRSQIWKIRVGYAIMYTVMYIDRYALHHTHSQCWPWTRCRLYSMLKGTVPEMIWTTTLGTCLSLCHPSTLMYDCWALTVCWSCSYGGRFGSWWNAAELYLLQSPVILMNWLSVMWAVIHIHAYSTTSYELFQYNSSVPATLCYLRVDLSTSIWIM